MIVSNYPADWPPIKGEIDLSVQDLPHKSSNTEWWYTHAHIKDQEGRDYTIFVAFFRVYVRNENGLHSLHYSHALNGAICDVSRKKYYPIAYMDRDAPELIRYQLENGLYDIDHRYNRALLEVVKKGQLPKPDVMFPTEVAVSFTNLNLDYGGNTFVKDVNGDYLVKVAHPDMTASFDLRFKASKKVMRQGNHGVVHVGVKDETMFYYSIPRMSVTGTISVEGEVKQVTGNGWYDHEFGGKRRNNVYAAATEDIEDFAEVAVEEHAPKRTRISPVAAEEKSSTDKNVPEKDKSFAWNWFAVQLTNGVDLSMTNLLDLAQLSKKQINYGIVKGATPCGGKDCASGACQNNSCDGDIVDNFVVGTDEEDKYFEYHDMTVEKGNPWVSVRSSCMYFLKWVLASKSLDMHLTLEAVFPEQEVMSMTAKPAFWEGRLKVTGTFRGKPVEGTGILERHNFSSMSTLDYFFKRISQASGEEIKNILPKANEPTHDNYEMVRDLMADPDSEHLMQGADIKVFNENISFPLRDIIDRGGKAWRSYALILCIDLVGGISFKYRHWLAMPEIMHVGSLIIDDIQDKSDYRRGDVTCHKKIGDALAINAGTAAYFIAIDSLLRRTPDIKGETRLRLYERYFQTLRAGHAGQAFDIYGQDHKMDAVVSGQLAPEKLIDSVVCTHRLKSAVPAGNLAYMGVLIGGGNYDQAKVVYDYFESVGIAFQIVDDILNLHVPKDSEGNSIYHLTGDIGKLPCEDLRCGKITFPVVMALKDIDSKKAETLWNVLKSKSNEPEDIRTMMEIINSVQALEKSMKYAEDLVTEAWKKLDEHIEDSFYKLMLRSFGWYVLERHY